MISKQPFLLAAFLGALCPAALAQNAVQTPPDFLQFAPRPVLGWNSWDCFGTQITEAQAKAQTDAFAAKLKPLGWQYVVVDIQWYEPGAKGYGYRKNAPLTLDEWGRLLPAPNRFPSAANGGGFKALADYVHGKGLKFGIHIMRGIPRLAVDANLPVKGTPFHAADIADKTSVCAWNGDMFGVDLQKPGAQAYYDSVYELIASWGVDFVKVDDISRPYDAVQKAEIEAIRRAIDKTGRPIVLSLSPGDTPVSQGEHVGAHANMWRISDDFWDNWTPLREQFDRLRLWTPFRGPGHFPDADMLPLGLIQLGRPTRFSRDEQRTLMSLWSIARSPLVYGGDLTRTDDWTLSLLTNPEVLAIDQNSSANRELWNRDGFIAWTADVPNSPDKYLALFNTRDAAPYDKTRAAFSSGVVSRQTPNHGVSIDVDISNAKTLILVVGDGGDNFNSDHADWVEPRLVGPNGSLKLSDLKPVSATAGYGEVSTTLGASKNPMSVNGAPVSYGFGTHAPSVIQFDLPTGYTRFQATGALDDGGTAQNGGATVEFLVFTQPLVATPDANVPVNLGELGFKNTAKVRDLWSQKDLGTFAQQFAPKIAPHGAGLYRVSGVK